MVFGCTEEHKMHIDICSKFNMIGLKGQQHVFAERLYLRKGNGQLSFKFRRSINNQQDQ